MPKYRKKPVAVEAMRFKLPMPADEFVHLCSLLGGKAMYCTDERGNYFLIETLEGTMRVDDGDYIIKGVQGEVYPCKPDIFEQTYDVEGDWRNMIKQAVGLLNDVVCLESCGLAEVPSHVIDCLVLACEDLREAEEEQCQSQ